MAASKIRVVSVLSVLTLLVLLLPGCLQQTIGTVPIPSATPELPDTATSLPTVSVPGMQDVLLLSMDENGYAHLFAYIPQRLQLTRLTYGNWSDVTPALSPDGTQVAFASNRSGVWDLYILQLQSGEVRQVTNTPNYESSPSWSPDGKWLAFETYSDENLDIAILSLDNSNQDIINLTNDPAADHSPAWAPGGRQVAFVSNRSGDNEIWLADLDKTGEERYVNLSNSPLSAESHPIWTVDGNRLAWASSAQTIGYSGIYVWDATKPERPAYWVGDGDWPAWNASGTQLMTTIHAPNQEYLTSYALDGSLLLQPTPLPGSLRGIIWPHVSLPDPFPQVYLEAAAQVKPPLWQPVVTPLAEGFPQRYTVNTLPDVTAPYPQLHDKVDESFKALRQRVIQEAGWDALATLSDAFVPLTTTLDPGLGEDWLYTGRAFALNPLMTNAGWMVAVRQDYGAQTYWKLYLRTQMQDGTEGEPLSEPPWDLAARYELEPSSYEQGGKYSPIPPGYWIDFTSLALQYGWERLPALPNWRTYYKGARFTEFALTEGLDWYSAMLEIYPQEVLVTPTRVLPPSPTPTRTPRPTRTPTATRTPSDTPTPSHTPSPIPSTQQ